MAKSLYDEVDGVYRKITKKYDGVEGIARNVTKCYDGVDGVARQYFMSGVQWNKYSCNVSSSTTYSKTSGGGSSSTANIACGLSTSNIYSSYSFSTYSGFSGSGRISVGTDYEAAEGYYIVYQSYVYVIDHVTYDSSGTARYYMCYCAYKATENTTYSYSKGSTSYGTVTAAEGELPESGTLIKGSATGSYCIVQVGSTYYYYTKVT